MRSGCLCGGAGFDFFSLAAISQQTEYPRRIGVLSEHSESEEPSSPSYCLHLSLFTPSFKADARLTDMRGHREVLQKSPARHPPFSFTSLLTPNFRRSFRINTYAKTRGEGFAHGSASRRLLTSKGTSKCQCPPVFRILFQVTYSESPLFRALRQTVAVWGYSCRSGSTVAQALCLCGFPQCKRGARAGVPCATNINRRRRERYLSNGTEKLSMMVNCCVSLGEPRTSTEILVAVTDSLTW